MVKGKDRELQPLVDKKKIMRAQVQQPPSMPLLTQSFSFGHMPIETPMKPVNPMFNMSDRQTQDSTGMKKSQSMTSKPFTVN